MFDGYWFHLLGYPGIRSPIVRLKDLSGALWDEDHHMIVLDDEHLLGRTKVRNCLDNTSAVPFLLLPYV